MIQLGLHMWGDYFLQNHWMATRKTENSFIGYIACIVHCTIYTALFVFVLSPSTKAILIIYGTHFLIDKYRLAKYVAILKGDTRQSAQAPDYIKVWLLFICDNIMHVTINYFALKYFP